MTQKNKATPAETISAALSVVDGAAFLRVSPDTIRRLIKSGVLAHARIGNSIRIRRIDLEQFLKSKTSTNWEPVDGRGPRLS